jgi:hypothetical protein
VLPAHDSVLVPKSIKISNCTAGNLSRRIPFSLNKFFISGMHFALNNNGYYQNQFLEFYINGEKQNEY